MPDTPPRPRVVDTPALAETYCDKLVGVTFNGSAVVVTLGTMRLVPEELGQSPQGVQTSVVVTNRIALAPALAHELIGALTGTLKAADASAHKEAVGKTN